VPQRLFGALPSKCNLYHHLFFNSNPALPAICASPAPGSLERHCHAFDRKHPFLAGSYPLSYRRDQPREIKLRNILVGYALFVLVGFLFTTFKYAVLLGQEINLLQVWDSLSTVVIISGVLMLALGLLAYLGNRRIDKQIS
jgi:hypothetical protein